MADRIGVAVVGTGFMGAVHALAFAQAPVIFATGLGARLAVVADVDGKAAEAAARRFGFARATTRWQDAVADPEVGLVSITTPNHLHHDIALAALAAGKHVYCEKPLAASLPAARAMAEAARASPAKTLVGYNYIRSPAIEYARDLVRQGAIGEVVYWRGVCDEDYMADPAAPFSWRCRKETGGLGALGDLASHLVSVARHVVGEIEQVVADLATLIPERPMPAAGEGVEKRTGAPAVQADAPRAKVENEDTAHALLRFAGGVMGSLVTSRVHWGRKNHLAFEVFGTEGSILFDHERMNEIQLFQKARDRGADGGFRTILIGPEHPSYGRFSPARGHGLGFNDLKVIEVAHLLDGIAGKADLAPTMEDALAIERVLHAITLSADQGRWVALAEV